LAWPAILADRIALDLGIAAPVDVIDDTRALPSGHRSALIAISFAATVG
jgi:hypothetical protein